jgi:hypothetical protein
LDSFAAELDYRLINEFGIRALISDCELRASYVTRNRNVIGPTTIEFFSPIEFKITQIIVGLTTTIIATQPAGFLVPRTRLLRGTADEADQNGRIERTENAITHRTAGRINSLLEPFERALLEKRAPPFASEITFSVQGASLVQADSASQLAHSGSSDCIWPTATVYQWDEESRVYREEHRHEQGDSPFVCFIEFGTPWGN